MPGQWSPLCLLHVIQKRQEYRLIMGPTSDKLIFLVGPHFENLENPKGLFTLLLYLFLRVCLCVWGQ